jgi:polyhydroxyalkanoate synthesis repressor PhaR
MVIKRYSNRRLYDTDSSRYVTLDEVGERIRGGEDLRFVDVPTGDDITQGFLAQIILESRGAAKLLPVPLLYRMVRMGDDALAEFFGRYVTWALDVYLKMKQGARQISSVNPLAALPVAATDALMRWVGGWGQPTQPWTQQWRPEPRAEVYPPPPSPEMESGEGWAPDEQRQEAEIAALRAELEGLKKVLREALGSRDG